LPLDTLTQHKVAKTQDVGKTSGLYCHSPQLAHYDISGT